MIQRTGTIALPVPLPLSEGGLLREVRLAYEATGPLESEETIVLLHDVDRSHRGLHPAASPENLNAGWSPHGWARALLAADAAGQRPVLFPNLLGSPFGSTSAGDDGWEALPPLSVEDMARAVAAQLRALGVTRVRAVVGVGLGGWVALQLAALFHELVGGVVTLGAGRYLAESLREKLALTPQLVESDPGDGARAAKKSFVDYLRRSYGRDHLTATFHDPFAAERALEQDAARFAASFAPRAWASLAQAYGTARLDDVLPLVRSPSLFIASSSDEVAPPARVRDAYHAVSAAGAKAHYYELQSDRGHAQLASEVGTLSGVLQEFLESTR